MNRDSNHLIEPVFGSFSDSDSSGIRTTLILSMDDEDDDIDSEVLLESASLSERVEVQLIQLLPDSCPSTATLIELDAVYGSPSSPMQDPNPAAAAEASIIAIPPAVLQRVISNHDSVPETSSILEPVLHGRLSRRLSVTEDGFMLMRNYKISLDVIGSGKLSEVRVAIDANDDTKYAIKIFSKTKLKKFNMLLSSRNPTEEAYREANLLRKLKHPNIIKMMEFIDDPDDENIYLVLELLDHVLIDIPSDSPYSEAEARKYFRDILSGVEYMHSCKIVHRDLKPDNMVVSKDEVVKIVDFNFCENIVFNEDGSEAEVLDSAHGTPAFSAPECLLPYKTTIAGRPLDFWSLGVTLYAMVVGDIPFKASTLPELFEVIIHDAVIFPEAPDVSEKLRSLIIALLQKNPVKRFQLKDVQQHLWMQNEAILEVPKPVHGRRKLFRNHSRNEHNGQPVHHR